MKDLKDTVELMNSKDYKERFIAEYWQTKIRYEKLKNFCDKIEVAEELVIPKLAPKHDCPYDMLREQQNIMGRLLHILELRAIIENIDLRQEIKSNDPDTDNRVSKDQIEYTFLNILKD